jgi:hypothetical protein
MKRKSISLLVNTFFLVLALSTQFGCSRFLKSVVTRENRVKPDVLASPIDNRSDKRQFENEVNQKLLARNFDGLEATAQAARDNKERFPGGYWKIDSVYNGIVKFVADYRGQRVNDEMWKDRIELLERWASERPGSFTAKVALAHGRLEYGSFVRGTGYIDSVSQEGYAAFHEQVREAQIILESMEQIEPKCPRWYREMMMIGMFQQWPLMKFESVFEAGIESEPNYLQNYLVKSENLTPKWNGEPGDWQKFVDSLPGKLTALGTDETDILYFVVVANKLGDPSLGQNWAMISKEHVAKGFRLLEKKYGVDNFRLNQYARLSCQTMNFKEAREAFDRIGNERDDEVWSERMFQAMRSAVHNGRAGNN